MKTVDISQLGDLLVEKIEKWDNNVGIALVRCVDEVAKEGKKELKKESPKGSKRIEQKNYRDCFVIRKPSKNKPYLRILWNKQYQLSHLLESGHNVYTRPPHTNARTHKKLGPLTIKHRSAKGGHAPDNMTTSAYEMWQKTEDDIAKKLYNDVIDKLSAINKL